FRRVQIFPRPAGIRAQPHFMRAVPSPGALRQGKKTVRWMAIEIGSATGQRDRNFLTRHNARHMFQPQRPFVPPVTEKFGVEWRRKDGRYGIFKSRAQGVYDQADIMFRVRLGPRRGFLWKIRRLERHVDLGARHLPVAMTTWKAFLVEVEIIAIARISGISAPNLQTSARIARENRDRSAVCARPIHVVRLV